MFCSKCGKQIDEGTNFCPSCGKRVGEGPGVQAPEPDRAGAASISGANSTVHFYRTKSIIGAVISAKLKMDGVQISTIRRNWKKTVTVPAGTRVFSARTEALSELKIQAEPGKEYFIRCDVGMGIVAGRIKFSLVDAEKAAREMAGLREEE